MLLIEGQKAKTKKNVAAASTQLRAAPVASEIDLRGMEPVDGVIAAERYIDRAVMGKLQTVTIIHGKGTGCLLYTAPRAGGRAGRDMVRAYRCVPP